jgi:hypothetical protein
MAETEQKIVPGRCPDHGIVDGVKEIPKVSFPFVVYGVRRAAAAMAGARCPRCGAKLARV